MPRVRLSSAELEAVARSCVELLVSAEGDVSAASLSAVSGLSERTFYRYFATKADCIRPVLEAGCRRFVDEVARRCEGGDSGQELLTVGQEAFIAAYDSDTVSQDPRFARILVTVPAYRRIWLEVSADAALTLADVLARAWGQSAERLDVRLAADEVMVVAVTALREMVRSGLSATEAAAAVVACRRRDPLRQRAVPA